MNYGFSKEIDASFEEALDRVSNELKKEGFGILSQIDVAGKFKEKLGIDFKKYTILGACNPPSAHKAILVEENIGLMLPCNVIIYERQNKIVVSIIKPTVAMTMIGNVELEQIASTIEKKLKKVFDSII
ncbi:MAG: ABC transporter ATP-binding protein [Deltaproteobacteria bacterium]|nr:MAG: ABC transporter ATP-binding protein [Deltaproteobacteria bacterium]